MKVYLTATHSINYQGRERWGDTIYDLPLTLDGQVELMARILRVRLCPVGGTVKYGHLRMTATRADSDDPRFVVAWTIKERACGSYNAFRFVPVGDDT